MAKILLNLNNLCNQINNGIIPYKASYFKNLPTMQSDSFEKSPSVKNKPDEDDNEKKDVSELVVYYYVNDDYDGYLTFGTADGSTSLCAHYSLDCPDFEPRCKEDEVLEADLVLDYIKEAEKLASKDIQTFIKQKQSGNTETEIAASIIGYTGDGRYIARVDGIPKDILIACSDETKFKEGDIVRAKGLLDCEFNKD